MRAVYTTESLASVLHADISGHRMRGSSLMEVIMFPQRLNHVLKRKLSYKTYRLLETNRPLMRLNRTE